jgi:hypothetical protein
MRLRQSRNIRALFPLERGSPHIRRTKRNQSVRGLSGTIDCVLPLQRESPIVNPKASASRNCDVGVRERRSFLGLLTYYTLNAHTRSGFKNDSGTRTTHHLIFVSKHPLGYGIMKEIMAKESSLHEQGVPRFQYSPADKRFPLLFELNRPLDDLEDMLLAQFARQVLSMRNIYAKHNVGRRFIAKNYKDALKKLEEKKAIVCNPPSANRKKDTFGDSVLVTFPTRGEG